VMATHAVVAASRCTGYLEGGGAPTISAALNPAAMLEKAQFGHAETMRLAVPVRWP
jgi:hypothetical protein